MGPHDSPPREATIFPQNTFKGGKAFWEGNWGCRGLPRAGPVGPWKPAEGFRVVTVGSGTLRLSDGRNGTPGRRSRDQGFGVRESEG